MILMDGTSYGIAMILSSPMEFVLVWLLAHPGLALRRAPRLLMSNCEILFSIDSSPFVPSWHLGKPPKNSAIQESPTSNVS